MSKYTVWVGGVEVNSHYLTLQEAQAIAKEYKDDGYDDVEIEAVSKAEQLRRYNQAIQ